MSDEQSVSGQDIVLHREVAESSTEPGKPPAMQAFAFGDPEPVLDRREFLDSLECWRNGRWYEPPISMHALSRSFRVGPHHSSAIYAKRNMMSSRFIPSRWMDRETFEGLVLDFLALGNCYVEERQSLLREPMRYQRSMARYTRRGVEPGTFFFVEDWRVETALRPGSVLQIMEADLNQEIYGIPDYLSGLQSAFLNEGATLFRRRYYLNGSHAGFIMYVSDPAQNEKDIEAMRQALKDSKGPGNFRNLFMYSPNGKKDGIQIIPISEVAAKDEFLGIKNTTRDDVLAAHRVPPQLLGVVPQNSGGFGDVLRATDAFYWAEIARLELKFKSAINRWANALVVDFEPYVARAAGVPAAASGA
ncbi:MAG: hypothetical protein RL490_789 [Pseudomonadota bacterium]|jgi:PBSX family phage portal protein